MRSSLNRWKVLAKRWGWLIILGIVLCAGTTYIVSRFIPPIYSASAFIEIDINTSTSAYDNFTTSELSVPTYAQLLTNSSVLYPVLARHPELTLKRLLAMTTVKPQSNTRLIELDVTNGDPQMAMQLANEIGQSLEQFTQPEAPGAVRVLPAELPAEPLSPKPLAYAGLGAVVGLGIAVALIVIFEWLDDRLANPEEVSELLGMEVLTLVPRLSRKQLNKTPVETPALAEKYRIFSASLIAAQAVKPFKLVMITSAVANEGKSTVAANVASFLALGGKQVLLVDANLYHPVLDQRFQLDNHVGLANVFLEMWAGPRAELYGQATNIPTLRVLTAGVIPFRSPEMLQSPLTNRLLEHFEQAPFDYIIFDAPPLLPVADAQILASLIKAIVVVVDANKTPREMLLRARSILNRTHTIILGIAINKSPWADNRTMRQYANHIWQPATDHIMPPDTPPSFGVGPTDTPGSQLLPPSPMSGTMTPDMTMIADPRYQVEMNSHHKNGYLQHDTRAQ